jgi:hypothetical protein
MTDPRQNLDTSLKLIVDAAMRDVAEASILIEQRKRVPRAITEALRNHVRKLILCLAEIAPQTLPEIEAMARELAQCKADLKARDDQLQRERYEHKAELRKMLRAKKES